MVQYYHREAAKFTDKLTRSVFADFFVASFARQNLNIMARICKFDIFHMSQPTRGVLARNFSLRTEASQI
jgi:hypothetical protein